MHVELAKFIIRYITILARISLPAVAIGLLANQIVTLTLRLHESGRLNRKVVRRVLHVCGFPIPPHRAFLIAMLPVLSLSVMVLRQAIELARQTAAGRALAAEVVDTFLSVWEALRGAYEDALADGKTPVDYVPSKPREHYPGTRRVTVQPGESLSLIALRVWNDALLWPLLYDANQTAIGPNHNLIHPGLHLVVPNISNLSQAELERVRRRGADWN